MPSPKEDITASSRKKDHINLAFEASTSTDQADPRFYYEPVLATMDLKSARIHTNFLGANMDAPIWVSSMTGGTELARTINHNLAKVCREFGLGMGLGSCRQLLNSDEYLPDFDVREIIGIQPLYANLGIAQVIDIVQKEEYVQIESLLSRLRADGLIIHINPLQEWMQPEGDVIKMIPTECIRKVLDHLDIKIIVKEVGQGFGPESLKALLALDIVGIELAGFGGTNFALLEALRSQDSDHIPLVNVGHSAEEMIGFLNDLGHKDPGYMTKGIIISGGIKDYLTGYYLNELCIFPSVYGQASSFLRHAMGSYSDLAKYVEEQIKGYRLASQYLRVRN